MTKPEFDRLYNEKIGKGLNNPLNDLLQSLTNLDRNIGSDITDFMGLFLAHQMAQNSIGRKDGDHIFVKSWQISNEPNSFPAIEIQFTIV